MTITVGSLFSGVGGFDLGFERAGGMAVRWQCEIDKAARGVLRRHWPDTTIYEDVHDVGIETPAVDVICGGFPCQDVSIAGRRAGLDGERSGLWFEFARILGELQPQWVVIENVPGLLSSNGGRDFAVILHGLVERGYRCAWRVLDSQYFGVPQRRRRLFIVGHLGDGRAAEVLFEREGGGGVASPSRQAGTDYAAPLTARTHKGQFTDPVNDNVIVSPRITNTLPASGSGTSRPGNTGSDAGLLVIEHRLYQDSEYGAAEYPTAGTLRAGRIPEHQMVVTEPTVFQQNQRNELRVMDVPGALAAERGMHNQNFVITEPAISFEPRYYSGRKGMAGAPSSLTGPLKSTDYKAGDSQQHVVGATAPRRLTPLECERLQGFPDGWTGEQSDAARYRQMGNAVTVNVAEWIGRRIVQVMDSETGRAKS